MDFLRRTPCTNTTSHPAGHDTRTFLSWAIPTLCGWTPPPSSGHLRPMARALWYGVLAPDFMPSAVMEGRQCTVFRQSVHVGPVQEGWQAERRATRQPNEQSYAGLLPPPSPRDPPPPQPHVSRALVTPPAAPYGSVCGLQFPMKDAQSQHNQSLISDTTRAFWSAMHRTAAGQRPAGRDPPPPHSANKNPPHQKPRPYVRLPKCPSVWSPPSARTKATEATADGGRGSKSGHVDLQGLRPENWETHGVVHLAPGKKLLQRGGGFPDIHQGLSQDQGSGWTPKLHGPICALPPPPPPPPP